MSALHLFRVSRRWALCGSAVAAALGFATAAAAQNQLPEVVVTPPKEKEKPKPKPAQVRAAPRPAPAPRPSASASVPTAPPVNPVAATANTLNQGLNTIYAPIGTIPTTISHNTIQALPGGDNTTVEKILLQVSRRDAGFGRQRQFPRPQRARQCADSASTASCCRTA